MGARGPRPAPKKATPSQTTEIPPCPKKLKPEGLEFWRWVIGELRAAGTFKDSDLPAIVQMTLCYEFAMRSWNRLLLEGTTIVIETRTGSCYEQNHPCVSQVKTFSEQLRKWFAEFGLTASGRSGAKSAADAKVPDALEEFLEA